MSNVDLFLSVYLTVIAIACLVWQFEKKRQARSHESPEALRLRRTFHVQ